MQRFIFRIRAATEFSIIKLLTLVHLGENLDDNDNDNSIVLGLSKKEIGSTMYRFFLPFYWPYTLYIIQCTAVSQQKRKEEQKFVTLALA